MIGLLKRTRRLEVPLGADGHHGTATQPLRGIRTAARSLLDGLEACRPNLPLPYPFAGIGVFVLILVSVMVIVFGIAFAIAVIGNLFSVGTS